ncbi:MAG: sel1 repeat family protein [Deltaproteobacteria bacterium]|nr:sel1 repeat family protein [Deltaproteobacteria bacterium]
MNRILAITMLVLICLVSPLLAETEAMKELKVLAEKGDAESQFTLGLAYASGQGVPQDYSEAAKWIHASAEQGGSYAQDYLGSMYEEGKGLDKDYIMAARYYLKAAQQRNASAQHNLGRLYVFGQGVPRNFVIGYMWLSLAAQSGDNKALALMDKLKEVMTPQQINEARKLAQEWKPGKMNF